MNTGLDITVHNLLAVYSGGRLDLSGAGYQPDTVEVVYDGPSPGVGMLTLFSLFLLHGMIFYLYCKIVLFYIQSNY